MGGKAPKGGNGKIAVFAGVGAAAVLAADLGRWRQSGAARRLLPCLGGAALALPRLLGALLPVLLLGAAGVLAAGGTAGSALRDRAGR